MRAANLIQALIICIGSIAPIAKEAGPNALPAAVDSCCPIKGSLGRRIPLSDLRLDPWNGRSQSNLLGPDQGDMGIHG